MIFQSVLPVPWMRASEQQKLAVSVVRTTNGSPGTATLWRAARPGRASSWTSRALSRSASAWWWRGRSAAFTFGGSVGMAIRWPAGLSVNGASALWARAHALAVIARRTGINCADGTTIGWLPTAPLTAAARFGIPSILLSASSQTARSRIWRWGCVARTMHVGRSMETLPISDLSRSISRAVFAAAPSFNSHSGTARSTTSGRRNMAIPRFRSAQRSAQGPLARVAIGSCFDQDIRTRISMGDCRSIGSLWGNCSGVPFGMLKTSTISTGTSSTIGRRILSSGSRVNRAANVFRISSAGRVRS